MVVKTLTTPSNLKSRQWTGRQNKLSLLLFLQGIKIFRYFMAALAVRLLILICMQDNGVLLYFMMEHIDLQQILPIILSDINLRCSESE